MRTVSRRTAVIMCLILLVSGCSGERDPIQTTNELSEDKPEINATEDIKIGISESVESPDIDEETVSMPDILLFRDVFGQEYQMEINPLVQPVMYDKGIFRHEGDRLYYDDTEYDCLLGVDVSHHQGMIEWDKVKKDGYDFAFLRIGYRGYGKEGLIKPDKEFQRNIANAKEAGLKVGVYFFAQAINENEAREEAEFVIQSLSGNEIELPVVYDPESILDHEARTDGVSGKQFTENTEVFCTMISEAGYQPMIYCNMLWEAFELDLEKLPDIPIWYADYEPIPQTPYGFEFWQYTNSGNVDGIEGEVDLDIWMRKAKR